MARITELEEDIVNANVALIEKRIKMLAAMKEALVCELKKPKNPVDHDISEKHIECIESAERIIAVLAIRFMPR
ncbi:EscE/YscE/SsaE family type III secretion system needle protein co-chaperone [Plesiomonas sp.]|uniref:EscE/YscE/SsaE family type III secretion system needle protein co-chaperone n=1 Tax=Plesiomonas sp. TaxID=2486279 RepID=UPI003F2C90E7